MAYSLNLDYAETGTLAEKCAAAAEAGFTAVSLGVTPCIELLVGREEERLAISTLFTDHGLAVDWLHAPFRSPQLYDRECESYALSMATAKKCLELGAALGARAVIVHPFNKGFPETIAGPATLQRLCESLAVLLDHAKACGVCLAVENIDEPYSQKILSHLFAELEGLCFCFDTGHAEQWQAWDAYLPQFYPRLVATHIHDNHGRRDEHLVPGDGGIDYSPLVSLCQSGDYQGFVGAECVQQVTGYPGDCRELAQLVMARLVAIFGP